MPDVTIYQGKGIQFSRRGYPRRADGDCFVKIAQPQFEGQTKAKLGNSEVRSAVEAFVGATDDILEENPKIARDIIESFECRSSKEAARSEI